MKNYIDKKKKLQGVIKKPKTQVKKTLQLSIMKNYLAMRSAKQYKSIPREVVESPSFGIFKTKLDKMLENVL